MDTRAAEIEKLTSRVEALEVKLAVNDHKTDKNSNWFDYIFKKGCNSACALELSESNIFAGITLADYNAVNAFFKLADCAAQTNNRHNFACNCDREVVFARYPLKASTKSDCDIAEGTVV